jgi:hypothetical protein
MIRLELGRSYLWAFAAYAALFLGTIALCAALGHPNWAVIPMPIMMIAILSSELRSGIALDSMLRASYPKGTWQYGAMITWHAFGLCLFLGMTYFFLAYAAPHQHDLRPPAQPGPQ